MRRLAFMVAVGALAASVAMAVPVRVDYNGEMVQPNWNTNVVGPINDPAYAPSGWTEYGTAYGNIAPTYATGSSANAYVLRGENEPLSTTGAGTSPNGFGGHGFIFGASTGVGQYGLSQTIASTAGKHYWFVGSAKGSTTATKLYHQWGLADGTSVPTTGGRETDGSVFGGSGTLGKQNFGYGMVATGSQVTAYFGLKSTAATGINIYGDGFRVLESTVNVYSSLYNGSLDGATYNVSNWSNGTPADAGSVTDEYMFDGWLPMGGVSGQVSKVQPTADEGGFGNAIMVDVYKGGGRQYFFQRVNDGHLPHTWDLSARAKTVNYYNADDRIGIDPTGGTDPTSPNVIWSSQLGVNNAWTTLSLNGVMQQGMNGITVFLATGWDFSRGNRIVGGTTYGADQSTQSWFDNITLTPEPTTVLFLAIGGIFCLRRR